MEEKDGDRGGEGEKSGGKNGDGGGEGKKSGGKDGDGGGEGKGRGSKSEEKLNTVSRNKETIRKRERVCVIQGDMEAKMETTTRRNPEVKVIWVEREDGEDRHVEIKRTKHGTVHDKEERWGGQETLS